MNLLFNFFPIILFFAAYKFYDIYVATAVLIATSVLQVIIARIKHRRFESLYILILISALIFGGATLFLHNELFIKWKPTAIYWISGLAFLMSQFFGEKNLAQRMLEKNIELPTKVWQKINVSWIIFFLLLGAVNLFVAYHFTTDTWVNFKVFGLFGLIILFTLFQGFYIAKHIKIEDKQISKE